MTQLLTSVPPEITALIISKVDLISILALRKVNKQLKECVDYEISQRMKKTPKEIHEIDNKELLVSFFVKVYDELNKINPKQYHRNKNIKYSYDKYYLENKHPNKLNNIFILKAWEDFAEIERHLQILNQFKYDLNFLGTIKNILYIYYDLYIIKNDMYHTYCRIFDLLRNFVIILIYTYKYVNCKTNTNNIISMYYDIVYDIHYLCQDYYNILPEYHLPDEEKILINSISNEFCSFIKIIMYFIHEKKFLKIYNEKLPWDISIETTIHEILRYCPYHNRITLFNDFDEVLYSFFTNYNYVHRMYGDIFN